MYHGFINESNEPTHTEIIKQNEFHSFFFFFKFPFVLWETSNEE